MERLTVFVGYLREFENKKQKKFFCMTAIFLSYIYCKFNPITFFIVIQNIEAVPDSCCSNKVFLKDSCFSSIKTRSWEL